MFPRATDRLSDDVERLRRSFTLPPPIVSLMSPGVTATLASMVREDPAQQPTAEIVHSSLPGAFMAGDGLLEDAEARIREAVERWDAPG